MNYFMETNIYCRFIMHNLIMDSQMSHSPMCMEGELAALVALVAIVALVALAAERVSRAFLANKNRFYTNTDIPCLIKTESGTPVLIAFHVLSLALSQAHQVASFV